MHSKRGARRIQLKRTARTACVAGLAAALALGGTPAAYAASASTTSELARLSNEVGAATATYSEANLRARELQDQIDALADEILVLEQETLPAQRELAADAAVNQYKMHTGSARALSMFLGAENLDQLIALGKYLDSIQASNNDALESLNDLRREMDEKLRELSDAKDQAVEQEQIAKDALGRAKSAQSRMASRAAAEDAEAARLAEEARKQIEQAEQQAGQDGEQAGQGSTDAPAPDNPQGGQNQGGGDSSQGGQDQGGQGGSGNQGQDGSSADQSGWKTGVASYYGIGDGFMGGTTASGEIVTETSMGIAMLGVPFGTRVEIRYGGRSVIAYVNDRGPYVHGRVIDMQPAVARALNFINVGVGTVQYRFL